MYNSNALSEVESMLCKNSYNEINELRYNVARFAIDSKLRKNSISGICKELVKISYDSLKEEGESEEKFLEPLISLMNKNKVPCDLK